MSPIEIGGNTYLTTKEAVTYAGLSRATLYNLKDIGRLHQFKQGVRQTVYWSKVELDALQEFRQVNSREEK